MLMVAGIPTQHFGKLNTGLTFSPREKEQGRFELLRMGVPDVESTSSIDPESSSG
jgi:hypothetical protein